MLEAERELGDHLLLDRVVETSASVAATSKRSEKTAILASLFADCQPPELRAAIGFLTGEPRQGSIGVGWATVAGVDAAAAIVSSITVMEIDALFDELLATSGEGSVGRRHAILSDCLERATASEQDFLRRILIGDVRQGAKAGLVLEAVAKATAVPVTTLRRAVMLSGDLGVAAVIAAMRGKTGLEAIGLTPLRPLQPMLASTASSVADAMDGDGPYAVEWKLDGIRLQAHKAGDDVRLFTRNLNEVTGRLPSIADLVRGLPAETAVLDGEVMGGHGLDDTRLFQDTMSTFGRDDASDRRFDLVPWFFDLLHVNGRDLIDLPYSQRRDELLLLAERHVIPGIVTSDPDRAGQVLDEAISAGHEGVMVKATDSAYQAGRRGKAWRKVKPVHTLDLVVLAAEWGHGRRQGWLSNLHLGARDGATGEFVMVGKTFKGLTDELLGWQTDQFLEREVERSGVTVHIRPELVVEIALDGVQRSTRYPGGVALRFARVRGYRDDKAPADADTIETVRELL